MIGKLGLATLSAALAVGLACTAEAAPKRKKHYVYSGQFVSVNGYPPGIFRVSPGDHIGYIRQAYPMDPNPPSLRQQYDLRSRLIQEQKR